MTLFHLQRNEDESGVSGTGTVAYGVQFDDGQCVLWWSNKGSIGIYRTLDVLIEIHGHNGKTVVAFDK